MWIIEEDEMETMTQLHRKSSFFRRAKGGLFARKSVGECILYGVVFLIFCFFAFSYLYILIWGFLAGLKTADEIVLNPFSLPAEWHFEHYIQVFDLLEVNRTKFFGMVFNSMYFSIIGSFLGTFMSSMLAYVTSKYKFFGSKVYYVLSLVMILLPIYGNGGSMYKLLVRMRLLNSRMMVITSMSGMGLYYMYFYAYYKNLSWSYAEAALIDGAGHYTVFFRIMFPQTLSLFGALFLLTWIGEWNNYGTALIYLPKMPTIAVGLYLFELEMTYHVRPDILYAACMLACIPTLVLFICFNKVLMSNISLGGIKE